MSIVVHESDTFKFNRYCVHEIMGSGDDIYDAFYYTIVYGGTGMRQAMWGDNRTLDIGDVDGDDNIFLWGNGLIAQMGLDP